MNLKQFFENEGAAANQRYLHADGDYFGATDSIPYQGANGEYFGAAAPAASAAPVYRQPQEVSRPIILNISNASTNTQKFVMFGAASYLFAGYTNDVNGGTNLTNYGNPTGITITPGIVQTVTSYAQLVVQTMTFQTKVGMIYIQNLNASTFITTPLLVNYLDQFGEQRIIPTIPRPNIFQQQNAIIEHNVTFILDANAYIIGQAPASSYFQVSYYPMAMNNSTRSLVGGQQVREYGSPNVSTLPPAIAR